MKALYITYLIVAVVVIIQGFCILLYSEKAYVSIVLFFVGIVMAILANNTRHEL